MPTRVLLQTGNGSFMQVQFYYLIYCWIDSFVPLNSLLIQSPYTYPNNDDALQNLRMCYSEIGDIAKLQLVIRKLNYLGC